jgi:hypothetical protein
MVWGEEVVAGDRYYSKRTSSISYYGSTSVTEPNMRQELINTLDGQFPEIAKGAYGILRRVSRESDGSPIQCECVDPVSKEFDKTKFCPICFSTGFLFEEEYIKYYHTLAETSFASNRRQHILPPGISDATFDVFYVQYDKNITQEDRIIEILLDNAGGIVYPVTYLMSYRIDKAWSYRSDNAKLEYWKIFTHQEETKFIGKPTFGE